MVTLEAPTILVVTEGLRVTQRQLGESRRCLAEY